MHCRIFSSIPGSYPLDTSSHPQDVTTKTIPDIAKCLPVEKTAPSGEPPPPLVEDQSELKGTAERELDSTNIKEEKINRK